MGRTMKSFKQFLVEADITKMLTDYTSGAIEDYDNKGSFINLFNPEGNGLPKLLSNFNLIILDPENNGGDGVYTGKGSVVKSHMVFKLGTAVDLTPTKTLTVDLYKDDDGDYVIKSAKVD